MFGVNPQIHWTIPPAAKMVAPNVGDFAEDLLEINQNVSYGVVPVRGSTDVTHSNSKLRDTPPLYEDIPNPIRSSNVDTATLQ